MASHFVSMNRGQQGLRLTDYTTGTATSANVGIELRVDDGVVTTRDVILVLESFMMFFANADETAPSGFQITN